MQETGLRMTRSEESVVVVFSEPVLRNSSLRGTVSHAGGHQVMGRRQWKQELVQQPGVWSVGFWTWLHGVDHACYAAGSAGLTWE